MHTKDSAGRLTTAAPHEATFATIYPTGTAVGVARNVQNPSGVVPVTPIVSRDSQGRQKTDGLGR